MRMRLLPAVIAATIGVAPASAAQIFFTALGSVATGSSGSYTDNQGRPTSTFSVTLGGFEPQTIADGDELVFDILLDAPFEVPAGVEQFVGLNFLRSGNVQFGEGTSSTGTIDVIDDPIGITAPIDVGCGNCIVALFGRQGGAFSFTGFSGSLFATLPEAVLIDGLSLSYQVAQAAPAPVPEPATWATMLLGFGLAGAGLRGRRRILAQRA